jgi:4-diphosphocytidyl-2-C-methyl-D-erythritol kinase
MRMLTNLTELKSCLAPAKLNLFLHVLGRRADGYHLLQSVFQLLDYGDTLHFTLRDDGKIRRTTPLAGVAEVDDLVVRAARLLQIQAPRRGVDIRLEKVLPMGGGLGGGSSDAATTLIALNHLWQLGLNREQLMQIGLKLGADVPFFLFGRNAFAEGVGEELQAIATPGSWYVVIEPGVSVPTPAIFSAHDLTRDTKPVTIADFSSSQASCFGKNDLQAVAARLYPPIAKALEWLSQYGAARMTGSGACVFCAMPNANDAQQVVAAAQAAFHDQWKVWCAKALTQHPMAAYLSDCG